MRIQKKRPDRHSSSDAGVHAREVIWATAGGPVSSPLLEAGHSHDTKSRLPAEPAGGSAPASSMTVHLQLGAGRRSETAPKKMGVVILPPSSPLNAQRACRPQTNARERAFVGRAGAAEGSGAATPSPSPSSPKIDGHHMAVTLGAWDNARSGRGGLMRPARWEGSQAAPTSLDFCLRLAVIFLVGVVAKPVAELLSRFRESPAQVEDEKGWRARSYRFGRDTHAYRQAQMLKVLAIALTSIISLSGVMAQP